MRKSYLLNLVIKRCKAAAGGDEISVDEVMAETLSLVADYTNGKRIKKDLDDESASELDRLKNIFAKFEVDCAETAASIKKDIAGDVDQQAIGKLLYLNITVVLDSYDGKNAPVVTLDNFVGEILEAPTEAVCKYILKDEYAVATDEEQNEEIETSDEDDAEHKEILARLEEARQQAIKDLLGTYHGMDGDDYDSVEDNVEAEEEIPTLTEIAEKAKKVHRFLSSSVYGQDAAVNTFVSGYFQAELSCLIEAYRVRPRATFLFAGPSGVGKTFLSEQVAKALGLPFMRFDMSEYSDKEANIEFCGSDKVYKNSKEGNVTGFVAKHPKAILLFDEVEKAHLNVIHLFLQILDAGRLRDNFTDEEVSFTDTIVIFTTNAGKELYEDERVNLSTVSRKTVIRALSADVNPVTGAPMFPAAICSRFAYGNVIMFNRMGANHLMNIAVRELYNKVHCIVDNTGVQLRLDEFLPNVLIYGEGGVADARTVKGRSGAFISNELYELFRLMQSSKNNYDIDKLERIDFNVELPDDKTIVSLFKNDTKPNVLLFTDKAFANKYSKKLKDVTVYCADTVERAEEILDKQDITLILCDVGCGAKDGGRKVLNIEDAASVGREFLYYAVERSRVPVYILEHMIDDISDEEYASLAAIGAAGKISASGGATFNTKVADQCAIAYQQRNLVELARANKVLTHKTLQRVSDDGKSAEIALFDFKLVTAPDAGDTDGMLDSISKPKVKFDDVIGASDAKEELTYFIDYLKNPSKFVKRGVRAPKGILLYGPPGTGKTLLAKAMAGESDVTFIRAEGNQFLKKYVGEGSESVHNLFKTARKYAPSILFIDEIDAIARGRGGENNRSDDVLTSFLTEMDGFNTDKDRPVFVLAATNYDVEQGTSRSLDAALLRRFDRKIYVDLPNKQERIQFIKQKLNKVADNKVSAEQIENIAVRSTGSSLADLDSVIELALRNVIKSKELVLTDSVLEEAFETFTSGDVKKWNESELLRTARHEAGHALMCYMGGETPSYLTIVARGGHGGYMQHADSEGKGTYTKKELLSKVRTALGGRAAEVVYYGDEDGVSTGASGDLRTATAIVENMICSYGMDETVGLGSVELQKISSTPHYTQIVARVNELLAREFTSVRDLIGANKKAIDSLVDALLKKNSLKSKEIEDILKKAVK